MSGNRKLLIIGLDGVSWNVLNPMIENGYMPFLKDFIRDGRSAILKSTEPPITPTAWTSFQTGLEPEEHGIWGFRNFSFIDGRLGYELNSSSSIRYRNVWQIISEHGKKVCVINLPLTYPPFEINGIMVSGFPVPAGNRCKCTYPEDFGRELMEKVPGYRFVDYGQWANGLRQGVDSFATKLSEMTSQKAQLTTYLLHRDKWDVLMIHFQETDFIQHAFWHYIDSSHPLHTQEGLVKCAAFYKELDRQLLRIVSTASEKGYSVLFISDHGFQKCVYDIRINNWLFSEGFLCIRRSLTTSVTSMVKKLAHSLFLEFKTKLINEKTKFGFMNHYLRSMINYDKSVAYVETNSTNIAFAHFITNDPELRRQFSESLMALKTPIGEKIIAKIVPMRDTPGIHKIVFEDGIVASGTSVTGKKWCYSREVNSPQMGVHHRDGIIISDSLSEAQILPESITQLFDFMLASLGIRNPFVGDLKDAGRKSLTNEEQGKIEESLKGLGYL
jgi:predicted AlkP superfamily phosphohydrolase/phosphomutase